MGLVALGGVEMAVEVTREATNEAEEDEEGGDGMSSVAEQEPHLHLSRNKKGEITTLGKGSSKTNHHQTIP